MSVDALQPEAMKTKPRRPLISQSRGESVSVPQALVIKLGPRKRLGVKSIHYAFEVDDPLHALRLRDSGRRLRLRQFPKPPDQHYGREQSGGSTLET